MAHNPLPAPINSSVIGGSWSTPFGTRFFVRRGDVSFKVPMSALREEYELWERLRRQHHPEPALEPEPPTPTQDSYWSTPTQHNWTTPSRMPWMTKPRRRPRPTRPTRASTSLFAWFNTTPTPQRKRGPSDFMTLLAALGSLFGLDPGLDLDLASDLVL